MAANNDRPPLIIAVLARNIVECRRLINTGEANVNGDRYHDGRTALHRASYLGYLEIAELLTSSGADVNAQKYVYNGRLEIAQLLICQRADMSIRNVNGITAIGIASSLGHLKEIAVCLRKWPWTMAIIALKEDLAIYHLLDALSEYIYTLYSILPKV